MRIPGQTLDVLVSRGAVGDVAEEQGIYRAELTAPSDEGEIKLQVIAPSGVMALVTIEVSRGAGAAASSTSSARIREPRPERAPRAPALTDAGADAAGGGGRPWLRARLSGVGSTYRYEQSPYENPGPLLPQALVVGGPSGGRAATPVGFEADGRAWLQDLPYLGFHGTYRQTWYAISASAFQQDAPDWLYNLQLDVAGRYPFDVGSDQFWVGAKAGFHYNDFITFKGCLEAGCDVLFEPLSIPGMGLGAELGAEVSDLFLVGGYTQGLARGTVPYSSAVDVNVGYAILDNAFVDLGFTAMSRRVVLQGVDTGLEFGLLTDNQVIGKVGAGFAL